VDPGLAQGLELTDQVEHEVTGGRMRFGPFLGIAILLFILWVGGFVFFHVAGFLIHVLLIFAVISLVAHLFTGPRTA
jgi:hypothetical protein